MNSDIENTIRLLDALKNPINPSHQDALCSLTQNSSNPDFILALFHVFARDSTCSLDIRQLAGLTIKNYAYPHFMNLNQDSLNNIKMEMISSLQCDNDSIRRTGATLISRLSEAFPGELWYDIIPHIIMILEQDTTNQNYIQSDGAMQAILQICEDASEKLFMSSKTDTNTFIKQPIEMLLPTLLKSFRSNHESIRCRALQSINKLLYMLPSDDDTNTNNSIGVLLTHMPYFIEGLSILSSDASVSVQTAVCVGVNELASRRISLLSSIIGGICDFMTNAVGTASKTIAIHACEFWQILLVQEQAESLVMPRLTSLVPALINRLGLTSEQLFFERAEEEALATTEQDINAHRTKASEDDKEGQELSSIQTVRKMSGLTLDSLASVFPEQVCAASMTDINRLIHTPPVPAASAAAAVEVESEFGNSNKRALFSSIASTGIDTSRSDLGIDGSRNILLPQIGTIWSREQAFLAMGTLSSGCLTYMQSNRLLPDIYRVLVQTLQQGDIPPEVRGTAAWVAGRYASWLFEPSRAGVDDDYNKYQANGNGHATCNEPTIAWGDMVEKVIDPLVAALLEMMKERQNGLQAASISCLIRLTEEAEVEMIRYASSMVEVMAEAFQFYGLKNSSLLCDLISVLCDIAPDIALPHQSSTYLPQVLSKFTTMPVCHSLQFAVMECLSTISIKMGSDFVPYIGATMLRTVEVLDHCVSALEGEEAEVGIETELIETSFDLAAALICTLESCNNCGILLTSPTLRNGQPALQALMHFLSKSLQHPSVDLKRAALGFSGDLTRCLPDLVESSQAIQPILSVALSSLKTIEWDTLKLVNNSIWCIGEICSVKPLSLTPVIDNIIYELVHISSNRVADTELRLTLVCTLGSLALQMPRKIGNVVSEVLEQWCRSLRVCGNAGRPESSEIAVALQGLAVACAHSPSPGILSDMRCACDFIAAAAQCSALLYTDSYPCNGSITNTPRELIFQLQREHPQNVEKGISRLDRDTKDRFQRALA